MKRKSTFTTPKKPSLKRQNASRSLTNPRTTLRPELKNADIEGSIGILTTGGWSELDYLNPIAPGTAPSQRVGRQVMLKSFQIRWITSSAASTVPQPIRVLVIYDRNPNGVLPLITDILKYDGFLSPMSLGQGDRFVILSDTITRPNVTNEVKNGSLYKKLNLPAVYSGQSATPTIADCSQGAIYITCALTSVISTGGIGYSSRIRYTDV